MTSAARRHDRFPTAATRCARTCFELRSGESTTARVNVWRSHGLKPAGIYAAALSGAAIPSHTSSALRPIAPWGTHSDPIGQHDVLRSWAEEGDTASACLALRMPILRLAGRGPDQHAAEGTGQLLILRMIEKARASATMGVLQKKVLLHIPWSGLIPRIFAMPTS